MGFYPDAPQHRMAYDDDGSVLWWADTTSSTYASVVLPGLERTKAQKEKHNNESTLGTSDGINVGGFISEVGNKAFFLIFPEQRDIHGINYWNVTTVNSGPGDPNRRNLPQDLEGSPDSTNGLDGTWESIFPGTSYPNITPWGANISPTGEVHSWDFWYRTGIVSSSPLPVTGRKAIRWKQELGEGLISGSRWYHIHVYGDKATGATPDRILFIDDSTGLEFTKPHDWEEVPRGTSLTYDIKLKNNSATLTANDLSLITESLTGNSHMWHSYSDSGASYATSLNITSIAPTASYPSGTDVIRVKLTITDTENLGINSCRIQVSTTSWT